MTRPSDVNEAINQALEVSKLTSGADAIKVSVETSGPGAHAATSSAGAPDSDFASPESSTAQTGNTGMSSSAREDVPERIHLLCSGGCGKGFDLPAAYIEITCAECCYKFAGERAEAVPAKSLPSPVLIDSNSDTPLTAMTLSGNSNLTDGVIFDESLALALDEGQNSSNAWRLHDHISNGLDVLARRVEGVLVRAKVVEPELVEVGR